MDLHGTDDWIFEQLGSQDSLNVLGDQRRCVDDTEPSTHSLDTQRGGNIQNPIPNEDALRQAVHDYELKQRANEAEKVLFLENFYRLLITARSRIKELDRKNTELTERLNSYTSVKCPKCFHEFKSGDSRLLPKYVRYLRACHRLELDFNSDEDLKRWLLISNLDTDENRLPVIYEQEATKTLKGVGSRLAEDNSPITKKSEQNRRRSDSSSSNENKLYRLDVENLSSRVSIQELKDLFGHVYDLRLNERNRAVVYFRCRKHLNRVVDRYQGEKLNGRRIKLVPDNTRRTRRRT